MTGRFVSRRRIVALSVAITLFAAPIASAQSPEVAPPNAATAKTVFLSEAAFARLAKQQPVAGPAAVVADSPRPSLLRQATAAMARQPQGATKAPAQKSWASRHTGAVVAIILCAVIGLALIPVIREGTS